jgi:hypothetical protein
LNTIMKLRCKKYTVMNEQTTFRIAGGSVPGWEHRRAGKNNQDAYGWKVLPQGAIALVADGCGSGQWSEVGAQLGVRCALGAIARRLQEAVRPDSDQFWEAIQQDVLQSLMVFSSHVDLELVAQVRDYWLFTLVGAVVTPAVTVLVAFGDGAIALNGEFLPRPNYARNAPPYLGYGLMDDSQIALLPSDLRFRLHAVVATSSVQSILLGSDGVWDLMRVVQGAVSDGDGMGAIAPFWQDDYYVQNPDGIRRRLTVLGRESVQTDWEERQIVRRPGCLPDDTTLVVLRSCS